MTTTTQPPSYNVSNGLATALESTALPMSLLDVHPPTYSDASSIKASNEKKEDVLLVSRYASASSSCPEAICPSKLPRAYASSQSRKRSCRGCCQKTSIPALTAPQVLSTSVILIDQTLGGSAMRKPASKVEANTNIRALKLVLTEVKRLRKGCHLSCEEKKRLKRELRPMEDDIKGALKDLKREKCRIC